MDVSRFSPITQSIGSRRHVLSARLGGALALALADAGPAKRHKNKKKHKKPTRGLQLGTCACPSAEHCQSDGSLSCPSGCRDYRNGTESVCEQSSFDCADLPLCGETADCSAGSFCRATSRFTAHCVPLCAA